MRYFIFLLSFITFLSCGKAYQAVIIRPAEANDLPQCIEITRGIYDKVYRPFMQTTDLFKEQYEKLVKCDLSLFEPFFSQKIGQILVAQEVENKKIVGYVQAKPFFIFENEFRGFQEKNEKFQACGNDFFALGKICNGTAIYLENLHIDEQFRGQGIGKKLIKSVIDYFPQAKRLYLGVFVENLQAISFYKHLEFCELDRIYGGKPDETMLLGIDTCSMVKNFN